MIYVQTNLKTADNSGVVKSRCIKVLYNKKIGRLGSIILVTVKVINPIKKIIKGSLQKGVVVRMRKHTKRFTGYISINQNALVIMNNIFLPLGTRILGPVCFELRLHSQFSKIVSLAKFVL